MPHLRDAALIDPRDAPATGADRVDVDCAETGEQPVDPRSVRVGRAPAADERSVEARPAEVGGDDVLLAELRREVARRGARPGRTTSRP